MAAALLAVAAIGASSAQAALFHVENGEGATITGSAAKGSSVVFHFKTEVPCLKSAYSGSMVGSTAESLTLSATISECVAWSMSMGSCDFILGAGGTFSIGGGAACSAEPIEIEPQKGCRVQVPPQEHAASVSYTNSGSGKERDVTATIAVTKLHYLQVTAFCSGGKGTFVNGELAASITLRADKTGTETQQGLWLE